MAPTKQTIAPGVASNQAPRQVAMHISSKWAMVRSSFARVDSG